MFCHEGVGNLAMFAEREGYADLVEAHSRPRRLQLLRPTCVRPCQDALRPWHAIPFARCIMYDETAYRATHASFRP